MQHANTQDTTTMTIVTDSGFADDTLVAAFSDGTYGEVGLEALAAGLPEDRPETIGLILDVDAPIEPLKPYLAHIDLIKVPFGSFADGRGFSSAVALRRAGFVGTLRATGHIIVDQYAHARRCGFDEVAITKDQAKRQVEAEWLAQVPKINETYQIRLHQADRAA